MPHRRVEAKHERLDEQLILLVGPSLRQAAKPRTFCLLHALKAEFVYVLEATVCPNINLMPHLVHRLRILNRLMADMLEVDPDLPLL